MKVHDILVALAYKLNGDWNAIYEFICTHQTLPDEEIKVLLKKINSKAVTIMDEDYPMYLKDIQKPPFVLFYHGDISLLKDGSKIISVVGARKYTSYGKKATEDLVGQLSKNFVIASGMAMGIDSIAHRTTFKNGGKTIAVLGCGINVCYIPDCLDIYEECKKNHLVISEYPDLTPPTTKTFPVRNRIIAGISRCLLVSEAKIISGTAITATLMVNVGGEVCCVPTNIYCDSLCNHLIASGAVLVESVQDIYDAINFRPETPIFEK